MGPCPWFWYTRYISPLSMYVPSFNFTTFINPIGTCMCVPSFNFVTLTVLEKQCNENVSDIWTEGQGKSSIAPLFRNGAIKKNKTKKHTNYMHMYIYIHMHHNLFITLFLGSKAKTVLAKQPCCIQTKLTVLFTFLYMPNKHLHVPFYHYLG